MPTDTNLSNFVINLMSQEQYDNLTETEIEDNQLYMTTEPEPENIQVMFETIAQYVLNKQNPVGKILITTVNINPETYLGFGTWIAWGSGKVPVGVNTSDTSFNTVEKTGGAKTVTLTESQIPSHSHGCVERTGSETDYKFQFTGNLDTGSTSTARRRVAAGSDYYAMTATTTSDISDFDKTANTGGGTAHSNLQPYITCYMWKRTA